MPESRLAQFSTSPLLQAFAVTASQKAIRPVGQFIAPLVEVPDLTFRYKKYSELNRFRVPNTKRSVGSPATVLSFSSDDVSQTLTPNALDFPIGNVDNLSDDGLQFAIMEGQTALADASALSLEVEIVTLAMADAALSPLSVAVDFSDDLVDPIAILDDTILRVLKASKNGAPVRVLFGATKFKQFRNNKNVKSRYVVSATRGAETVGLLSPQIEDVPGLLLTNSKAALSFMLSDKSAPGQAEDIRFLVDSTVLVFSCNNEPNRMDPSFMKTFTRFGGLFRSGEYLSADERDQVLKMDWTSIPVVTNSAAVAAIS
jgi:hypothetical protein